jgi:hypothetical protein
MPAKEVRERLGPPTVERQLPNQDTYWDYSREPFDYYRVSFGPDGHVREVRNLFTAENFAHLRAGMTPREVETLVGVPSDIGKRQYGDGTRSWTYRYRDIGTAKLLHVIFDPADRVLWHYTEWDPEVYSKGDSRRSNGRR